MTQLNIVTSARMYGAGRISAINRAYGGEGPLLDNGVECIY